MKRVLLCIIAVILALAYFQPAASATLKGGSVTVCHYNASTNDYTQVAITLTDAGTASNVGGHINDTTTSNASDIWQPFSYSDQYTQLNIPGSKNWLVYKLVTYWITVNRVRHQVTGYLWVNNDVTQHIFFNGCKP